MDYSAGAIEALAGELVERALTMSADEVIERMDRALAPNYGRLCDDPVVRASGPWLETVSGRRIFDGVAAYSAANLGHGHPLIKATLRRFLDSGAPTVLGRFLPDPYLALLCEQICRMTGFDRFLPANGGVEGPEAAVKLARRWGYREKGIQGEAEIIFAERCFHGRTLTVTQMFDADDAVARGDFGPFPRGFVRVPYADLDAIRAATNERTCAVLLEPIQGEGGINIPPAGFLRELKAYARQANLLVILDEVQTGWGRTGDLFRWESDGPEARPDILCVGKSLSGGFTPVAGILADDPLMQLMGPGSHGSTFGGAPLSSAVALAALTAIEHERLPEQARQKGEKVQARLEAIAAKAPRIQEVRGAGLMFGIEIDRDGPDAHHYTERLLELGAIVKDTHEWVLRFTPPIVATEAELDGVLDLIEQAFTEPSALNQPQVASAPAS